MAAATLCARLNSISLNSPLTFKQSDVGTEPSHSNFLQCASASNNRHAKFRQINRSTKQGRPAQGSISNPRHSQNMRASGDLKCISSQSSELLQGGLSSSAEWGLYESQPLDRRVKSKRRQYKCQADIGGAAKGAEAKATSEQMEFVFDPKKKMDDFASKFDPDQQRRTNSINLFSPSKINLFLLITSKRPDGYHDLASLFYVIDLGDRLKFTLGPGKKDALTSTSRFVPLGEKNLVIKALNVFREKTGIPQYFWIHLEKKVPTGAGLGGGSGNAATALWAANELTGRPASNAQLMEWGAEIGSDVPVFFSRGAAYCTGRGEIVQDIQPPPVPLDTPMVLIKPRQSCKTPEIFKKFSLDAASKADPQQLLESIKKEGVRQEFCINDLEDPAFEVLPSLKRLKERIMKGGRGKYSAVFMSGSGSTIVGVGDPEPPQFIYDEERYQDVFVEPAYFLTREEDEWYRPSRVADQDFGTAESRSDLEVTVATEGRLDQSFFENPESYRVQI